MDTPTASEVKWFALFFAIFFTATSVAQYVFVRYQMRAAASKALYDNAAALSKEVAFDNGVDLKAYNQAVINAFDYFVVLNDGTILDFYLPDGGLTQNLVLEVSSPVLSDAAFVRPVKVTYNTPATGSEGWWIYAKKLADGIIILGISDLDSVAAPEQVLVKNIPFYGNTVGEARHVDNKKIDNAIRFTAVIDSKGWLVDGAGRIPLKTDPMALGSIPAGISEQTFDGKSHLVLYTPLKDASGKSVGTIIELRDISHDDEALDNVVRFDIAVGNASFFAFLILAVRYSTRRERERRAKQAAELERLGRLKSFFSAPLADAIVAGGGDDLLKAHRREITVVFTDIRGFTPFTEDAEPEEVMEVLRAYHQAMGSVINNNGGTLEHFAGDGIMIFFNDPVPMEHPADSAARMALAMHEAFVPLAAGWRQRGFELGLGIGIATGFAMLGAIGFEGRWGYAANGNVANLAARLCSEAKAGETLIDRRTVAKLHASVRAEDAGELMLKGFTKAVPVQRLLGLG